jgi:hypothetical protein
MRTLFPYTTVGAVGTDGMVRWVLDQVGDTDQGIVYTTSQE